MVYNTPELEHFALTLPLTQATQQMAQQMAQQQPNAIKAEQVRRNALAVLVVKNYLDMLSIPTQLTAGDSWNPIMQLCADVADLVIPEVGRLECRPVNLGESVCCVPPEVWHDRVGYVIVELNEAAFEATLLGFVRQVSEEALPLTGLQPIELLLDDLNPSMDRAIAPDSEVASLEKSWINLSQWLQHQFATGWDAVDTLLNPPQLNPAYGFRSTAELAMPSGQMAVSRAKLVDLGANPLNYPAALVIELNPESANMTDIRLAIHPIEDAFLPPDLGLMVLDESGDVFLETRSMGGDFYLQLQFMLAVGDRFSIQLTLNDITVTETFVV